MLRLPRVSSMPGRITLTQLIQRTPHFINDGLMHFHGVVEVPFGFRSDHPALARLPALHDFAARRREKKE